MIKKKKNRFAIVVDETGRDKLYLKKLVTLLEDEYDFLKQQSRVSRDKPIGRAKFDDVIVFGSSKLYDFTTMDSEDFDDLAEDKDFKVVDLYNDFKKVKKLLGQYAENNYPKKYYYDTCCEEVYSYCRKPKRTYCDDTIIVEVASPKRTKRRTSRLVPDKATVHHNFVKVGYDLFDIKTDPYGEEYVKVDGNTYWIDRDSYGNGKLSTR